MKQAYGLNVAIGILAKQHSLGDFPRVVQGNLGTRRPGTSTRTHGLTPGKRDGSFAINISTEIGTFSAKAPPRGLRAECPGGKQGDASAIKSPTTPSAGPG